MEIFQAYDIRGRYPEEINKEIVFKIAAGMVRFLTPDKLVVAHDGRKSSEPLKDSVIAAITAFGVDVIDIGQAATPLFYFAINKLAAAGGIMVTASHNRPEYNGLKLVREKAVVIGESSGLKEIKNLTQNIRITTVKKSKVAKRDLSQEYVDFLLKKAGLEKEPETPENIRFEFDPDSDRLLVFEKTLRQAQGKQIRADLLSGVIIKDFLEKQNFFKKIFGKPRFVYDLRFSKAIPEYIKQNGGEAIRSRVGHVFMKEAMRENKALFGAELSGHFYFKVTFYAEAPVLMKLKLLKIMQETGKSISELIKPFQKYFHSGEVSIQFPASSKCQITF
ncbi:MAG: hypothetical protein HY451_01595 [Parcubacteria group bacterium]|nr:hypothetical protein [Parcubacteria group bacterium]